MKTEVQKPTEMNWTVDELNQRWTSLLEAVAAEEGVAIPLKRLRHQAEIGGSYSDVMERWPTMSNTERVAAWKDLGDAVMAGANEMLPVCVQCGRCCQEGSPTLMEDDLELLQSGAIPWNQLVTLRKGEPAHSPFTDEVFYLTDEYIKLKEREGTKTCLFYDETESICTVHVNRPMQCRAQECWDEEPAKLLAQQTRLTREMIFGDVEVLLEMIGEYDDRFGFEKMRDLFDGLKESEGETADQVVDFLARGEHFREFVAEKLTIPADTLDLVFGRSLTHMVRLFGFEVIQDEQGTNVLRPAKG